MIHIAPPIVRTTEDTVPQSKHPTDLSTSRALTSRWTRLKAHSVQQRLWTSRSRFKVVPAGRRSGKTEQAKRNIVIAALSETRYADARFLACAPTREQAKRIYWKDLKALVPAQYILGRPRESELIIPLINGAELAVVGMDEPQRVEGSPISGIILDEYANMKRQAWTDHVRPALSDRGGWAWLIGVPEGRNHYHETYLRALSIAAATVTPGSPTFGQIPEWDGFTWKSADILPPEEIESARTELDPMTFAQEYEASFITFQGRAYYSFDSQIHACQTLRHLYNPEAPLIVALDFNVEPGVAVIMQEVYYPSTVRDGAHPDLLRAGVTTQASGQSVTAVLGEVWIPQSSNTEAVCRRVIHDWAQHKGDVLLYGDSTGGGRRTQRSSLGTDWEIVKSVLREAFGSRVRSKVITNPEERARVNATNSRIKATSGQIRLLVDPKAAPHVVRDFEGVTLLEGGSGEIDTSCEQSGLNHISSAVGYYINARWPIQGGHITLTSGY